MEDKERNDSRIVSCHQYATGRGINGYGFTQNSWQNTRNVSINSTVKLRTESLSTKLPYLFEINPASTDFKWTGVSFSRRREAEGTASYYTHMLLVDSSDVLRAMGLLDEKNFLSPGEFTELTRDKIPLEMANKETTPVSGNPAADLKPRQKESLGAFLNRYWALLEEKWWPQRDARPAVALRLPATDLQEQINYFAAEVMGRLPKYVRPLVSVAFGVDWQYRGTDPCVCAVVSNNPNSSVYYTLLENEDNHATKPGDVDKEIARCLMGDREWPAVYRNIEALAERDDAFAIAAGSYSVMAFSVIAEKPSASLKELEETYDKLTKLLGIRYHLDKIKIIKALLPLSEKIIISMKDDREKVLKKALALHKAGLSFADLESVDEETIKILQTEPDETKKLSLFTGWYDELKSEEDAGAEPLKKKIIENRLSCIGDLNDSEKEEAHLWAWYAEIRNRIASEETETVAGAYAALFEKPTTVISIEKLQRIALIRLDMESKDTIRDLCVSILSRNMETWREKSDFGLESEATESEKNKNDQHFGEVVEYWLKSDDEEKRKSDFESVAWTMEALESALSAIKKKLKKSIETDKVYDIVKPAEEELYEWYKKKIDGDISTKVLAICVELKDLGLPDASERYRELYISKENRANLRNGIGNEKVKELLKKHDALLDEVVQALGEEISPDMSRISAYLDAVSICRETDESKAEKFLTEKRDTIIQKATEAENVETDGYRRIAELIMHPDESALLENEKLEQAFAFVKKHSEVQQDSKLVDYLLERAKEKKGDEVIEKFIFSGIEWAVKEKKTDPGNTVMRSILKKTNNQMPDGSYPEWQKVAEELRQECVSKYIGESKDLSPARMRSGWADNYAGKCNLEWDRIRPEMLKDPVKGRIDKDYPQRKEATEASVKYLSDLIAATKDDTAQEPYTQVLKSIVTEKLAEEYNELWKGAKSLKDKADVIRENLDGLVDELRAGDKVKETDAGHARAFMEKLKGFNKNKDSDKYKGAGSLIKELEDAKGYDDCLDIARLCPETRDKHDDSAAYLFRIMMISVSSNKGDVRKTWAEICERFKIKIPDEPWQDDNVRFVNKLSWLVETLKQMGADQSLTNLREYFGADKCRLLWSGEVDKKVFGGKGKYIMPESLLKWIELGNK